MKALLLALVLVSCATPPEVVREPVPAPAAKDAGADVGGSEMSTPNYGSVLVVLRTANGEEYTIMCGGEVSLVSGTGRTLLKLDRSSSP